MQGFAQQRSATDVCDSVCVGRLAVDQDTGGGNSEMDGDGGSDSPDLIPRRPTSLEASLNRLHVNLGHASVPTMLRMLKHACAKPEVLKLAASFKCSICESVKYPKLARPASVPKTLAPFRCVAFDVKELPGWRPHQRIKSVNVVCESSGLQQIGPFHENETSELLIRQIRILWFRPYLRPK